MIKFLCFHFSERASGFPIFSSYPYYLVSFNMLVSAKLLFLWLYLLFKWVKLKKMPRKKTPWRHLWTTPFPLFQKVSCYRFLFKKMLLVVKQSITFWVCQSEPVFYLNFQFYLLLLFIDKKCKANLFHFYFLSILNVSFFTLADTTYRQRQRRLFLTRWLWAPLWTEAGRIEQRVERELALRQIKDVLAGKVHQAQPRSVLYVVDRPLPPVLETERVENQYEVIWPLHPSPLALDTDSLDPADDNIYDRLHFQVAGGSRVSLQTIWKQQTKVTTTPESWKL